jgi:hypothetical protein
LAPSLPPSLEVEKQTDGSFAFAGAISGVTMQATIKQTGTFALFVLRNRAERQFAGSVNPIEVFLIIGNDGGKMSVNAVAAKVAAK